MKRIYTLFLAIVLCITLTACSSSKNASSEYDYSDSEATAEDDGYADYPAEEAEAPADEPAAEEASDTGMGDVSEKEKKTNRLNVEKLIYKCTINIETKEFEDTLKELQKIITKYDGFIEQESTYMNGEDTFDGIGLGEYVATIRVPSDKYKDFINETGGIGKMISRSQNVTNVSQEYSDLSVELEVLETQKDNYLEMLKEAKKLSDMDNIIKLSDKIASVSTDINKIKTRLNAIDNDVDYSYVDINIDEVRELVEYTDESFGTRFMTEVKQGWYDFGYGFQNFLIWLVAHIWGILLFVGIHVGIIIFIVKMAKRGNKKRRAQREKIEKKEA